MKLAICSTGLATKTARRLWPSRRSPGLGCDALVTRLTRILSASAKVHVFDIPASDGQRLAWLHAHGEVTEDIELGEGEAGPLRRLTVSLVARDLGRFAQL